MRQAATAVQEQHAGQLRSVVGALVTSDAEPVPICSGCGDPMGVQKTVLRQGHTLAHGTFEVRETVSICGNGCRRPASTQDLGPAAEPAKPGPLTSRSATLARLLLPRRSFGYDVMTFVGMARFVHHRQREEIRATLLARYGIEVSCGEVSILARDFVVYLEALHRDRAPALRALLDQDGGWPMHIDATGEDGRGTLFVAYAGWRGWVLGSWKIPTERADAILPRLLQVADLFGDPCAIMRDLGRAMIDACLLFVAQREASIPILGCAFHFLKDVGKDLLTKAHDELRDLFRRFKVRSRLRAISRDLGRQLGSGSVTVREDLGRWLAEAVDRHVLPGGQTGLAAVRVIAQWVLDYPSDGKDEGFPFDLPYLDLWSRCQTALRATEAFLRTPNEDEKVRRMLERLHRILAPVRSQVPFLRHAAVLETRTALFTQLREALRLQVKPTAAASASSPRAEPRALEGLRDIQQAVDTLTDSLRARRPERGPAEQTRKAIDIILQHLDKHGPSLWGHAINLPQANGGGVRLVDRTNLPLEAFFHRVKHGERRRSGRKILTQDLESCPAAAILATNLAKPDYVAALCGTLDDLPAAFASLDAGHRTRSLSVRQQKDPDLPTDLLSASLPASDRSLVRSERLTARVLAAARSRAPRRESTGISRTATVA